MTNNNLSKIETKLINTALGLSSKGSDNSYCAMISRDNRWEKSAIIIYNPYQEFRILKITYSKKAEEGKINFDRSLAFSGSKDFVERYKEELIKEIPEIKDRITEAHLF